MTRQMKCRSVACLWSGAPPSHRVTAAAALTRPSTLYTGGSDGSIIWWNVSLSELSSEIKPIAMLCGHAAPIADLAVCDPTVVSRDENKVGFSSDDFVKSTLDSCGALMSACTDGVLCVWSRNSGHCRRRRKLPPWVGTPSIICTLSSEPRYVCIGCSYIDSHSLDSVDAVELAEDKDFHNRKPPKCTVVIVDTYTLTIVQTVFHGSLSIGPLKFMGTVLLEEQESLLMADSYGQLQFVPMSKDTQSEEEDMPGSGKGSFTSGDAQTGGESVISVIIYQKLVALLTKSRCIFLSLSHGEIVGEIPFIDNHCPEGHSPGLHVKGAMFLESFDVKITLSAKDNQDKIVSENLLVWTASGSAMLYALSYINGEFAFKILGEIITGSNHCNEKSSLCFVQLNQHILRVESTCHDIEEPFEWRPHVSIWAPCQGNDIERELQFKMLGEGSYFAYWFSGLSLDLKDSITTETGTSHSRSQGAPKAESKSYICRRGKIVSSSMVISENMHAPYAVVYGLYSGEIEIVKFELLRGIDSPAGSPRMETDSLVSKQQFLGHTGAVLSLAAHRISGAVKGWSFTDVLISGSMDCTIRVWDLDNGNIITVMHHHVAPVRQIILAPARTERPWSDCFLSVGDDSCVALASLETLRVERMFPGHPKYPAKVVWDGSRGYIACLCQSLSRTSDPIDVLYIWDVKTGARERVLRGTASHSMFDHFCKGISVKSISGTVLNGNTSVSSLLFPVDEERSPFYLKNYERVASSTAAPKPSTSQTSIHQGNSREGNSVAPSFLQSKRYPPIKCTCPIPGISALIFDLSSLAISCQTHGNSYKHEITEERTDTQTPHHSASSNRSSVEKAAANSAEVIHTDKAMEEYLIRFSLSFLHLWGIDAELDRMLITQMRLKRPVNFIVASGLQGDKGSLTLTFPGLSAILELWKSSSEFSALRSLMMVSLAQCMVSLSHSTTAASSALAAFYTRNFAEKYPDLKPPLLQLLVTFWQDGSEQVRMAARSLFHCAASLAIPPPLCNDHASEHAKLLRSLSGNKGKETEVSSTRGNSTNGLESESIQKAQQVSQAEEAGLLSWMESFEVQDWTFCIGGTGQDAMASHIIVAAALSIWYPSLVKRSLAMLVVRQLMKLVMAMNEKYSSTAAELLAEGMETTWKPWISSDIPRIVSDIFFQIECVSGPSVGSVRTHQAVPTSIRETLVRVLLPSLAMADILGFISVIESQLWSTASDSPVHLVSLRTLIRVVRGSPRNAVQHLDKVVSFILQTMDPSNSVMRKTCVLTSMATLKEVARAFPMVALNNTSTRLAIGDAVADINNASIRVYDMQSVTKIKVLDASGPPGLPSLLGGASEAVVTTAISALSFSPDGEGLVAFSENGLMIRWWSLGSVWWEKLSRSYAPVQCTKLIFVPPWDGFSSNSSRSSVISSIMGHDHGDPAQETMKNQSDADRVKQLVHNLDLSYRLEWVGERKVLLTRHGVELGTFPL